MTEKYRDMTDHADGRGNGFFSDTFHHLFLERLFLKINKFYFDQFAALKSVVDGLDYRGGEAVMPYKNQWF